MNIYVKAISHYGVENQITKSIEELAELIQALAKGKHSNIAEEMADVKIMLKQLEIIHNNKAEVQDYKTKKLKRLEERINDSKR